VVVEVDKGSWSMIEVQVQDTTGNWRTYSYVNNESLQIRTAMQQLHWQFPDSRIRAVDQRGSVVDIL
jgi:hypothetical protein